MSSASAESPLTVSPSPIEVYRVHRRRVYVKREDLCAVPPAPPLGKLRGLEVLVRRLVAGGATLIGCWDTRVSKLGHGLAAFVRRLRGVRAVVCYPHLQGGTTPEPVVQAAALGAEIVPMRGNHVSICFAQARQIVEAKAGVMLPFGLDCPESVTAIAAEARQTPPEMLRNGTVVLSCGSGVTLSGLLTGFDPMPRRIVGVSAGRSVRKLEQCVRKYVGRMPRHVTLLSATMPYDHVSAQACPFPAHPNYDLKAWAYLADNLATLSSPVLFWNIGA
ncbi:MAG: pyridoxal-phosphate dependent enzyme [Phycisphaerae bacterium]|jgi:1-aminocyclopropane-1-carboxylate deaminase/D-cysteine desulfhydrase-like pyridoxal-dependent ACC family enzyme